jgi:hypothetical protein
MTELGYIERSTNFAIASTGRKYDPASVITSLDLTIVGTGAAVEVEFFCPAVANPSAIPTTWFVVTVAGTATAEQFRQWPASTAGTGGSMRMRKVLANGTSYKFQVGLSATSGTTTAKGTDSGVDYAAMYLRVTG